MVGDNKYASTIITLLKINILLKNWKGAVEYFKVTSRCLYEA